ncbi:unnamed protein product, partial [Rhizoctonia solani]
GHECTWGTDGEDNGRPATKQFVESLRVKIQQLESEVALLKQEQHQTQSPLTTHSHPSSIISEPSPVSADGRWGFGSTPSIIAFGQVLPEIQAQPLSQSHTPLEFPHLVQPTRLAPVEVPVVNPPSIAPVLRYEYIFNIDTSLSLDEQYPAHRASLICQWNRYLPDLSPVQFSRFEHDTILSRCFSYGACCSLGIVPDLFLAQLLEHLSPEGAHSRTIEESKYYTPLLHCSLLAFGAGLSDNPAIRAQQTRGRLATQAKERLDEEFNNPSLSLMISLVLLSQYHSGIGERNTGYMYMGMALRAARIHSGLPNSPAQDWHCWSVFIQESLMALEINRPSEHPVPLVPISCPIAIEPESRPPLASSVTELLAHRDYFKYSARCFIQMCRLIVIITQMINNRFTDKQIILDVHLKLEIWFNSLPDGVMIRQRAALTFPPVLALHIVYWWFILHSHSPISEQSSILTTEPVRDLSVKMCSRATDKLVQLFNTFDKQFGLRYFPRNLVKAIYACGCALVIERDSASSASRKKRATAMEGIEFCIHALKVIGDIWPVAICMSEELESSAGIEPSASIRG